MKKQFPLFSLAVLYGLPFDQLYRPQPVENKGKSPGTVAVPGGFFLEQGTGIEPASSAWEADVLPMY